MEDVKKGLLCQLFGGCPPSTAAAAAEKAGREDGSDPKRDIGRYRSVVGWACTQPPPSQRAEAWALTARNVPMQYLRREEAR